MGYVVTEACIKCKFMDCVEICPVSCFHEGENMLVIDPEVCIDCGVCEPVCPAGAIVRDSDIHDPRWEELNKTYAKIWPQITQAKIPPADADDWIEVKEKYERYFSPDSGDKKEE